MLDAYKPIIGVIARPDKDTDDDEVTTLLDKVRIALLKKNAIPLMITPTQLVFYDKLRPRETPLMTEEEISDIKRIVDMCDALLLPGGFRWYQFDEVVYKYALQKNMPILGICCGMQMMCKIAANKNDVATDTTVKNETEINHKQRDAKYVHKVEIKENTKLYSILKEKEIMVNSKHNYHAQNIGDLTLSALSEDGLIEGVEYTDKNFVIGTQWHPETMLDYDDNANKIMDEFINESKKYSLIKKM